MKKLIALAVFLSATVTAEVAYSQSASAQLLGTTSLGNGGATIAFSGTKLKTDIFFANLDAPSKGAYILCCNADPTKAIVATANLIDNVAGKTFGSKVFDFETDKSAFWDSAFSGGDIANARLKLSTALTAGEAHMAITSDVYPTIPGEVSGVFALPVTTAMRRPAAATGAARALRDLLASGRELMDPFNLASTFNQLNSIRTPPGEPYGFFTIQPAGVTGTFLSAGGNDFRCSGVSQRCVFPVYVSSTYNNQGVAIACEARVDYGVITVPPHGAGKTMRVVWQLVEGDINDSGDYRFMDIGIDLSNNDPTKDFNGKGRESADGKRYKWLRVGTRTGQKFEYNAWVERFDTATGRSIVCRPADPMIANAN